MMESVLPLLFSPNGRDGSGGCRTSEGKGVGMGEDCSARRSDAEAGGEGNLLNSIYTSQPLPWYSM
jgi:hypothetical protein